MDKLAVVAIGGNSLIRDKHHLKVEDQYRQVTKTVKHIVSIIQAGFKVVITHGNGPQVGFIMKRSEIAHQHEGLHFVPLQSCVANTQGAIGYQIQQAMTNEFRTKGLDLSAATVVTQVRVSETDPGLLNPSKPIGAFYDKVRADKMKQDHPDWHFIEDAGRGYRRVVPSPVPEEIVEMNVIQNLVDRGFCVVAAGGGGIPVVRDNAGMLEGVAGVIDKDYTSALLARNLNADLLVISTSVDRVCLNFGQPDETPLDRLTADQAEAYKADGQFAAGSMLPKIEAILWFLKKGGKRAIITKPDNLARAIRGKCGTHIVRVQC